MGIAVLCSVTSGFCPAPSMAAPRAETGCRCAVRPPPTLNVHDALHVATSMARPVYVRPMRGHVVAHAKSGLSKPPMSKTIMTIVRHAKQQAARHGSLFVNLDHLVLGLLQTSSAEVNAVFAHYNVDFESACVHVDGKVVIPLTSKLEISDVDLSPQARDLLMFAQECAMEQGAETMGSVHLAAVLLQAKSPLRHLLEVDRQVSVREVESKVLNIANKPEEAGAVMPVQQQVQQLREDYKRMKPGAAGGAMSRDPSNFTQGQVSHDDIYE